jgi:hypothetical protein
MSTGMSQRLSEMVVAMELSLVPSALDQKAFEEITEDMTMEGHEQVAARRATGLPMIMPSWAEIQAATDESMLLRILHCAAIDPAATDRHAVLGYARIEGATPTTKNLEDRGNTACRLIEVCMKAPLNTAARQAAEK